MGIRVKIWLSTRMNIRMSIFIFLVMVNPIAKFSLAVGKSYFANLGSDHSVRAVLDGEYRHSTVNQKGSLGRACEQIDHSNFPNT